MKYTRKVKRKLRGAPLMPGPSPVLFGIALSLTAACQTFAGSEVLAPGYGPLQFPAPAANTYRLPPLGDALDGDVIDTRGQSLRLHDLFDDRIVLLSFIYSRCDDVNGCPLATAVLHKVTRKIAEKPGVAAAMRIVSLSFDPRHDTPEVLRNYGEYFRKGDIDWQFVTTDSEFTLQPILEGYDQAVSRVLDEAGNDTGQISHILRVFLIDRNKKIRNIYSTSFLHADTLISDIETLQKEEILKSGFSTEAPVVESKKNTGSGLPRHKFSSSLLRWATEPPPEFTSNARAGK